MKRALLIAGGTVGGLGAVLSITPPQFGSQGMTSLAASAAAQTTVALVPQASAPQVATHASTSAISSKTAATPKATKRSTPKVTATKRSTVAKKHTPAATKKATPTSASTTAANQSAVVTSLVKKVSGTFVGSTVYVNYGNVQVEITVVDGKITDAHTLQAPSGRSDRYTKYALPVLRTQTLAAQSANIQGASGASYTSYGWYTSLQVALSKAGL